MEVKKVHFGRWFGTENPMSAGGGAAPGCGREARAHWEGWFASPSLMPLIRTCELKVEGGREADRCSSLSPDSICTSADVISPGAGNTLSRMGLRVSTGPSEVRPASHGGCTSSCSPTLYC